MASAASTICAQEPLEELVARSGRGEASAEATLCLRFAPAVRAFARRRLRNTEAVEEFTQDVMVHFVEALRRRAVEEPARVGGFVLGICRNLARERARTRDRRAALWEQYGEALAVLESDGPDRSPHELAHLEDCLSQLAQRSRDVIRFAYLDGESNVEIAARLEMSEGNVRVVRHRALGALRDCMSQATTSWEAA